MSIAGTLLFTKILGVFKLIAKIGVSVTGLVLGGLYFYQGKLIYPSGLNDGRGYCATPDEFDMPDYELVELETADGETLQCYLLKQDSSSPNYTNKTVLMLSPNAGNIGHALPIVAIFYKNFGYNVFIFSYRGYGKSTGYPNEAGIKIDADTVMAHLTKDKQYLESSIVLYGRSLGGAVAIYLAATQGANISALILENTFLSIRKTAPRIFPFLKYLTFFIHQIWDLESLVSKIPDNIPVLLLSARKDEIVPPDHMDKIQEKLRSTVKIMFKFDNSTHNDTVIQENYWERVHEFIKDKVNPVGY